MNIRWSKMESWHAIQHESDAGHSTFCGRVAQGEVIDDLPSGGKGCESCDRILIRLLEAMGNL